MQRLGHVQGPKTCSGAFLKNDVFGLRIPILSHLQSEVEDLFLWLLVVGGLAGVE